MSQRVNSIFSMDGPNFSQKAAITFSVFRPRNVNLKFRNGNWLAGLVSKASRNWVLVRNPGTPRSRSLTNDFLPKVERATLFHKLDTKRMDFRSRNLKVVIKIYKEKAEKGHSLHNTSSKHVTYSNFEKMKGQFLQNSI